MNTASQTSQDSIIDRMEDQIFWYDRKSLSNQRAYKRIKIAQLAAAATIPLIAMLI